MAGFFQKRGKAVVRDRTRAVAAADPQAVAQYHQAERQIPPKAAERLSGTSRDRAYWL